MKIAFNPSTVAALIAPPNNKDITFDLRGHNIFARGVKFCGTDTNTWRDIKINNVSIDSNILDLRDGSNTTLTNINGVVTINSTWRPVVDNLTSDSTTSSLSANQGRVLKALIDGKSDSEHTHDDRYVKKTGDTMLGALNFANGTWNLVGDDSYMGDCNISGHFGIKAANTTYPGISFFNNANAHLGNLTAYSGNIKYGAYSLQFLDNGNTNVSAGTWMNPFNTYNASAVADGQAICVWGQSSQLSNLAADSGDMSLWLKRVNSNVATLNMVLDGEYYANGNQRLAHVSEIPNSLKNPYALTISLNGTSQGPYDGSAAKNINITPSSIGAATSDHNHDGRYLKLTGGVLKGQIILPDIDVNTSYTGTIIIGASNTENLGIDGNEIMARNNGKASTLYLNNEGGAVQLGAILRTNSNIAYIGSQSTQNMIKFINNTSDPYGNGIAIGGGGLTIIGSGESSDVVMNQHSSGGDENMIIAGDNNIDFYSNLQDGWQYGKHMYLDTNGFLFTPSYINIGGNENNNSSPDRVWGSNGSDSYLRSYRTSALRVAYASSTGNADLLDGYHYNDFTYKKYISYNRNGPYNMKIFSKDISSITWGASYLIFDIFSSGYNSNRVYFGKYEVSLGHWNNTDKNPTVYSRWIFKTNSAYDCVHVIKDLSNYTVDVYIENNLWDCSMGLSIIAIDGFKMVPSSSWVNLPSASGTVQLIGTTYLSFMGNADMLDGYHASELFTALSNSDNGISITVGGTTKSVSNISVNYASSAGNADTASKLQTPRKIWGQSFDGTGDVNGTIYINNNNSSEGAIRLNNNINSNARISAIDDQVIFNTGAPIRFGETSWDWNQWAGLKYTHSNKTIYLGIADGSIFNSNSAQSGGTLNLRAGIRNIDLNSGTSIRGLPTNGSPYSSRVTLNDTSISLSAYGGISMSTGPGAIELSSGYSGIKLSCQGNNASIDSEGFKVEASRGVYLNSGNSGNVYLCQGGNVGIGTTSPTYKLHVAGDIYTTTGFKKNGSSDSYVLLGGGGHKALSDFASSSHSHNYAANENYGGFTKSGRLPISGFYQSEESESGGNAPWSSWMHLINCQHSNINNNYALQIAASFFDNNTFKIRVTNDNVNNAWRDIIHSGNIGSQTVANAYHLYINSANTWSTWYWAGQSGQPSWLWGSNDGTNMYVWDPNNFNVHTAQYLRSLGNQNCQTGRTQNYGDVYTYNTYANNTGAPTDYTSVIGFGRGTAGTVEIAGGWCNSHLYWRSLRDCCEDWYSWRAVLDSSNYTEFINNYYWADVKISTSSSTTTSPTVSNLTATNSIRMGNILLEHTDEINNSTNGGIHLNYRNSGNITLCYGGGNVGIGTPSPTYKLDVNGQVRASGFRHSSVNSDNYMLLAGGGYKSFGGDSSHPVFLGYLNLDHGSDGTVSSSFYCLGYLVSFTYTRGGNYCRISIPDTSYQVFYIKAAIASVNYSGGGMDTWTGNRRGDGAWWLHCYASSSNEVRVKGFRLKDTNNDSWWGGNPLIPDSGGANRITVCIFGYVSFR